MKDRITFKPKKNTVHWSNAGFSCVSDIHQIIATNSKLILSILVLSLLIPAAANAHRGAKSEVDTCRFSVAGEVVHFSAYTPTFTAGTSYCHNIPNIGLTHLVFDYEGAKLRHTTVEFEITKEPEGSRVYYHEPEKFKKGSVDAKVDFSGFGAGQYLAHVTTMYNGEKIDSHLPFAIGVQPEGGGIPTLIIFLIVLVIGIIVVMMIMSRIKGRNSTSSSD